MKYLSLSIEAVKKRSQTIQITAYLLIIVNNLQAAFIRVPFYYQLSCYSCLKMMDKERSGRKKKRKNDIKKKNAFSSYYRLVIEKAKLII